jgi:hypothetical protein
MRHFAGGLLLAIGFALPGFADAPATSPYPRPDPRGQTPQIVTAGLSLPLRGSPETSLQVRRLPFAVRPAG